MKAFGDWLHSDPTKHEPVAAERPAESAEKRRLQDEIDILRELVTDNFSDLRFRVVWEFRCCCCEQWRELEEIEHYSPDKMYCGGSPSCCP